jgi:hypothetical protein
MPRSDVRTLSDIREPTIYDRLPAVRPARALRRGEASRIYFLILLGAKPLTTHAMRACPPYEDSMIHVNHADLSNLRVRDTKKDQGSRGALEPWSR